jgi:hypothetical protein
MIIRRAFGTGTAGGEGAGVLTRRTSGRHLDLIAAVMALQPRRIAVLDQPGRAVRTLHPMPAIPAEREGCVTAAIEKENRLSLIRQGLVHGADQTRRQPLLPLRLVASQIDQRNLG